MGEIAQLRLKGARLFDKNEIKSLYGITAYTLKRMHSVSTLRNNNARFFPKQKFLSEKAAHFAIVRARRRKHKSILFTLKYVSNVDQTTAWLD